MFNLDEISNEHNEEHTLKWPYIPDYPYRMLIIDPKAFMEYSADMDDVYNNINDYNPGRKRKILIFIMFDDMIADIMTDKKIQAIIKKYLFGAGN